VDKLIFIVDDEQAISKLLSYWAKDKWKYQVETFANAEDALKNLSKKPDVVLLDIMMKTFLLLCFLLREVLK
jgi:DNA-binding NtrC family response regulator